jgi:hypothetical protein
MTKVFAAAIMLLAVAESAHAGTDFYTRMPNSNGDLDQAFTLCVDDWGLVTEDRPATWEFKRCMLQYGWRYDRSSLSADRSQHPLKRLPVRH